MYSISTLDINKNTALANLDNVAKEVVFHNHIQVSHEMILNALSIAKAGKVVALGCGNCADIPLTELSRKFQLIDLVDMKKVHTSTIHINADYQNKIVFHQADITGMIKRIRSKLLKSTSFLLKDTDFLNFATHCLLSIAPSFWSGSHKYSLVISSGLLTQLQASIRKEIEHIFLIRFPQSASMLLEYPIWIKGIWKFAREIENAFIQHIQNLLLPEGVFYLADTVHVSWLFPFEKDSCVMHRKWIATKTGRLADYLPENYHINKVERWNWARFEPEGPYIGRLYDVQAVISTLKKQDYNHLC